MILLPGGALTEWALPILFLMAAAETAFVTGLAVPAGIATALAAFLAAEGHLPLLPVAAAATAGAAVGDTVGFWLGRRFGRSLLEGEGRVRTAARRHEPRVSALFGRHPAYAVSLARTVSFVRTLMPWAAGMSRMTYPRYLAYDALGVAGWAATYLIAGTLAGRSWRWVSGALGTGWAALFLVAGAGAWLVSRLRTLRGGARATAGAPEARADPPETRRRSC